MINSGDHIIIAGDSWAAGEWAANPVTKEYGVTHTGLEYYMSSYRCRVLNLGKGAFSDRQSIDSIVTALREGFKPDKIFWIQTAPLRDLRPYSPDTFPKSLEEFMEVQNTLLVKSYQSLASINLPIHCIGGTTKLNVDLLSAHKTLNPLIPSIYEFFGVSPPQFHLDAWVQDDAVMTPEFTEQVYDLLQGSKDLPAKWFYPDGFQPNRTAHQALFEYILSLN